MRDAAREERDWVSIHRKSTIYDDWDADMLFGCVCDAGFQGWDCSQRICPKGDDPLTPGLDEVQLVECTCLEAGGCANNTLSLTFKGQRTDPIPADATADLLEYFLEKLSSITDVDVHFDGGGRFASAATVAPLRDEKPNKVPAFQGFHRARRPRAVQNLSPSTESQDESNDGNQ